MTDTTHPTCSQVSPGMARPSIPCSTPHAPSLVEIDAAWGPVKTVGDMVRNLLTLDQDVPIHAAFHVDFDGGRCCRTRPLYISRERVIDGKWVDSSRKDVPYEHVLWAKPDERQLQEARNTALEEAAMAAEGFPHNRDWVPGSLYDTLRREVAVAIRKLKRGQPTGAARDWK